jgi:hypothetical protein
MYSIRRLCEGLEVLGILVLLKGGVSGFFLLQRIQVGSGTRLAYCVVGNRGYFHRAAFLKLWFADHKWSSGSALVVLLD